MNHPATYNQTDNPVPDPEWDCEGEGGADCRCHTCLHDCCESCKALLVKKTAGDEYYRECPDCGLQEDKP